MWYFPAGWKIRSEDVPDLVYGYVVAATVDSPKNLDSGQMDKDGFGAYEDGADGTWAFVFGSPVFVIQALEPVMPSSERHGYLDWLIDAIGVGEALDGLGKELFAALDKVAKHQRHGIYSAENNARSWSRCRCYMCSDDRDMAGDFGG